MEGICKRLTPACILLDVREQNKEVIIQQLVDALHRKYQVKDPQRLMRDIMGRERLSTTCIGAGCAVPHAHSVGLETSQIALARLSDPIEMDAPDGEPIDLIFLLVGPPKNASTHLKILSKLARLLHQERFRTMLRSVASAEQLVSAVCDFEE